MPEGIAFRLTRLRPVPIVEVEVNGLGPLRFILDTGASMTVITPAAAQVAGIKPTRQKPTAVGAGGQSPARLAKLKRFRVGTHAARDLEVVILNLSHVEKPLGIKLDGIIGYNFLRDCILTIDYPHRMLYLHPAEKPR
jgi:predicted aspartyl protease